MIYLLIAIGLTPGGSSTVHIYTQRIRRITQSTQTIRTVDTNNILGTFSKVWKATVYLSVCAHETSRRPL